MKSFPRVDHTGMIIWFTENKLIHRDNDLPAIIEANGSQAWFKNGFRHRDNDKPAMIRINGVKEWYKDGARHRAGNQPAVVYPNGEKEYWIHGRPRLGKRTDQIINSGG